MKNPFSLIALLVAIASFVQTTVFMRNIWPTEHWDYGERIKPLIYQALLK